MTNNIQPISFRGQVVVTTFNRGIEKYITKETTPEADELLMKFAQKLVQAETGIVKDLTQFNSNMFIAMLEHLTGIKIRNINAPKAIYVGSDSISFADKEASLVNGVKVNADLDL